MLTREINNHVCITIPLFCFLLYTNLKRYISPLPCVFFVSCSFLSIHDFFIRSFFPSICLLMHFFFLVFLFMHSHLEQGSGHVFSFFHGFFWKNNLNETYSSYFEPRVTGLPQKSPTLANLHRFSSISDPTDSSKQSMS